MKLFVFFIQQHKLPTYVNQIHGINLKWEYNKHRRRKMDDNVRKSIGLKKFSIISPVLNGQVKSNKEYFRETAAEPVDMPFYGMRKYSVKTLESWLYEYNRSGIDGLIRSYRNDKGKSRKISDKLGEKIAEYRKAKPKLSVAMLYEKLISEGFIDPLNVSRPTLYRYIEDLSLTGKLDSSNDKPEILRFSHEHVGDLWQGDLLYGPIITVGRKRLQTYLHLFLDDCSRYPVYTQFYFTQNFESLRHCFKEAVLRRGIPKLVYTDNAKIYRSQQFGYICASLGCTLVHSQPFDPKGRGKVERMFRTVRLRFLSALEQEDLKDLETLNRKYFKWLEEDYLKKVHGSLNGKTPHDVLVSQASKLRLVSDVDCIPESFLLRITRKVQNDATFPVFNVLYETDMKFSGRRIEIRYEPEWLSDINRKLPVYLEGKKVGEAKVVRFHDNAHAKRKLKNKSNKTKTVNDNSVRVINEDEYVQYENTISYYDAMKEEQ
jgi:putative transposase